ncbi:30-kDa cleavage and polyadenylation specificity factor 30-like [Macadamia integrifolia]|uniref:30-kDa cleavage and polyadenylation specificity factor 30-like n=1 Tax=Macadamia integrifolia TaxID=60698 RepID=UPI001C4EB946|nr:30-kDa cleavage and polyadenylation specificity factor 30-like [Macadamia integrifolia]
MASSSMTTGSSHAIANGDVLTVKKAMENTERVLNFDFEDNSDFSNVDGSSGVLGREIGDNWNHNVRRNFRKVVCSHWLRGLCMRGDACMFLHQYDKSRMPICRFFRFYGRCREQDCIYKHITGDIKECKMYKENNFETIESLLK